MKIGKKFLIRVIYKNGASEEFWTTEFNYKKNITGDIEVTWKPASADKRPILMNVDSIDAIWQLKHRPCIIW
jgi:hypothetical protein